MRFKALPVLSTLALCAFALPCPAYANACAYEPATRTVVITIDHGQTEFLYVGPRGTIESGSFGTCVEETVKEHRPDRRLRNRCRRHHRRLQDQRWC